MQDYFINATLYTVTTVYCTVFRFLNKHNYNVFSVPHVFCNILSMSLSPVIFPLVLFLVNNAICCFF